MPPSDDKDDEDAEGAALWAYVMRGVKPLPGREAGRGEKVTPSRLTGKNNKAQHNDDGSLPAPESLPSGRDIDRRTQERLRRGRIPIEGRIDLHGLTQDEARAALNAFITKSYRQGKRLVLVITGKGKRGGEEESNWWEPGPGILRQRVPEWLDEEPLAAMVLQFHAARRQDGGEGALYVLLRRKRS